MTIVSFLALTWVFLFQKSHNTLISCWERDGNSEGSSRVQIHGVCQQKHKACRRFYFNNFFAQRSLFLLPGSSGEFQALNTLCLVPGIMTAYDFQDDQNSNGF